MSRRFLSVDPPDLGLWPTAKGLAHQWREQWRLVAVGLVCAFVYSGLSLAIPIVIRHAIDSSIAPTNGHHKALWPYLVAVVLLALVRFGVNFTRRYATARTGIRVAAAAESVRATRSGSVSSIRSCGRRWCAMTRSPAIARFQVTGNG